MTLIYSDKYRGWGKQQPPQWGPVSAVKSAVRDYYENSAGIICPDVVFSGSHGCRNVMKETSLIYTPPAIINNAFSLIQTDSTKKLTVSAPFSQNDSWTIIVDYENIKLTDGYSQIVFGFINTGSYNNYTALRYWYSTLKLTSIGSSENSIQLSGYSYGKIFAAGVVNNSGTFTMYGGRYPSQLTKASASKVVSSSVNAISLGGQAWNQVPSTNIKLAKLFHAALTDGQIEFEYRNFYAAIQPRLVSVYFFPSAGGGGDYTLSADGGSYSASGQDVSLLKNSIVSAGSGSYSESGADASLLLGRVLTPESGSYSTAGASASLLKNSVIAVEAGSCSLTGSDVSLLLNRVLSAGAGSFSITGADVDLVYSGTVGPTYTLSAAGGSFTIGGEDVALLLSRVVSAGAGDYAVSGQVAALLFNRIISALTGSFDISGTEATLIYSGDVEPTYLLSASSGGFSISGSSVDLLANRILSPEGGAISLSGTDAALLIGRLLSSGTGTLTISGEDAALLKNSVVSTGEGGYSVTGKSATLQWSGLVLPSGQISITFTADSPGATFTATVPGITFTVDNPDITFN